jgi:hypothetical protein
MSSKVFLNTLLHEWLHHYDFHGLWPACPYQTGGFFTRLRALADALEVGFVLFPAPDDPPGRSDGGSEPVVWISPGSRPPLLRGSAAGRGRRGAGRDRGG